MSDAKTICLRLDPARLLRWHVWLAQELRAIEGVELCIQPRKSPPWPPAARALLALEKTLYGGSHACDAMPPQALPPAPRDDCGDCHAIVSLVETDEGDEGVIAPLYDRATWEYAALAAILEGRAPMLDISMEGRVIPAGLPAMENPDVASRALDNVMARVIEALVLAVRHRLHGGPSCPRPPMPEHEPARAPSAARAARFAFSALAARATARIARLAGKRAKTWMTGWRLTRPGQGLRETFHFDENAYAILPDDGKRFFADPFVFVHEGRRFVFVEEYPFATGKGVISVFEVDEKGRASAPRVVLEEDVHLSYPHVFAHGGDIWMIPESEAASRVALYRCVEFPHRWERAQTLLDDVSASDATLWRDGENWWMFAALRPPFASSWDSLGLFSADDLSGPWRPHAANPVLLDARAARPAGALFERDGALYRPAQDCAGGYGAGLSLCRVERLDGECFLQETVRNFRPRFRAGFHTLNAAGGLEVVDFFG